MSTKQAIPDAWDDDWTDVADTKTEKPSSAKLTKAEKRAQHQQLQKELWDSAENPSRNLWLEAKGAMPTKQEFKPSMTVLSRKPTTIIAKRDTTGGIGALSLQDDDDSEEELRKRKESELEARQRKAKLEREEKVRKYAEARERIMGTSAPGSPKSKPDSRDSSQARNDQRRPRGKNHSNMNSQPTSAGQSPARQTPPAGNGQLFDPEDMTRRLPKRELNYSPDINAVPKEGEPVRQPRGPESNGRGGFGFASRGGRSGI